MDERSNGIIRPKNKALFPAHENKSHAGGRENNVFGKCEEKNIVGISKIYFSGSQ